MIEVTNADRAWWAFFALGDFVNRTGVCSSDEAIGDLIADLLHLARAAGLDPYKVSDMALATMNEEMLEDEEGDMMGVAASLESMMDQAARVKMPWR